MKPKGAEFLEGKEFLEIVLVVRVARNNPTARKYS